MECIKYIIYTSACLCSKLNSSYLEGAVAVSNGMGIIMIKTKKIFFNENNNAPVDHLYKMVLKKMEPMIFLLVFSGLLALFIVPMGLPNMLNTMMNTAYRLLIDTAFYILAIAVLMSALSALLNEFGIVRVLNKVLSLLMKPLYGLPGAASLGILTTYLSDNPAILSLAYESNFQKYFKKYQFPALTNLGTSFGMGLIVTSFMIGLGGISGTNLAPAALIGNVGAIIGSIVSTRLMLHFTAKKFGRELPYLDQIPYVNSDAAATIESHETRLGERIMNAILDGGKNGVILGMGIIPGVLIICTLVMMLSNGAGDDGAFTGAAYEGIGLLPYLAGKISFILEPLFGFSSAEAIAIPITALGAAGAAIGLVPSLLRDGLANAHDIAVFTAMCMCWSGFLSTHVSMMDSLNHKDLTGKAILSHTIGGLTAGIAANLIYLAII